MGFDGRSGDTTVCGAAMHGRPGITTGAFRVIAALMAGQNRRKSASIQKHQGLFTALKGLTNRV